VGIVHTRNVIMIMQNFLFECELVTEPESHQKGQNIFLSSSSDVIVQTDFLVMVFA